MRALRRAAKIVSGVHQRLHGEIVHRISVVQKRDGHTDRQTDRQTNKNSTLLADRSPSKLGTVTFLHLSNFWGSGAYSFAARGAENLGD